MTQHPSDVNCEIVLSVWLIQPLYSAAHFPIAYLNSVKIVEIIDAFGPGMSLEYHANRSNEGDFAG
jgi:hypothetical protein